MRTAQTNMTSRIERLQKQRDQLNARLQTERAKLAKKQRADDTRRKILIGAAILKAVDAGEIRQDQLKAILKKHLSRTNERKFMGVN